MVWKVSIIIPCKKIDDYTKQCIDFCKNLEYPKSSYEIIVLPDDKPEDSMEDIKIIPTGPLTPGAKRNIGIKNAEGEIYAFIDSDAYPSKEWLENALKYLNNQTGVAAVGGPGLTPPEDSSMQKASGLVFSSLLMGGLASRYKQKKVSETDEVHSCNLIVHKEVFEKIKGWNEKYWPGEDTLLCLEIRKKGWKIVEAQDVVVYHHRKPLFKKHLGQVWQFGLHRGFFAKKFGGNSLKLGYFFPSFLLIFLLMGLVVGAFSKIWFIFYILLTILYVFICLFVAVVETRKCDIRLSPFVFLGIMTTHLTYGLAFLLGLTRKELKK